MIRKAIICLLLSVCCFVFFGCSSNEQIETGIDDEYYEEENEVTEDPFIDGVSLDDAQMDPDYGVYYMKNKDVYYPLSLPDAYIHYQAPDAYVPYTHRGSTFLLNWDDGGSYSPEIVSGEKKLVMINDYDSSINDSVTVCKFDGETGHTYPVAFYLDKENGEPVLRASTNLGESGINMAYWDQRYAGGDVVEIENVVEINDREIKLTLVEDEDSIDPVIMNGDEFDLKPLFNQQCFFIDAKKGDVIKLGYYEGTTYKEVEFKAIMTYSNYKGTGKQSYDQIIELPIEKSKEGYFSIDTSELARGLYGIIGSNYQLFEIK